MVSEKVALPLVGFRLVRLNEKCVLSEPLNFSDPFTADIILQSINRSTSVNELALIKYFCMFRGSFCSNRRVER